MAKSYLFVVFALSLALLSLGFASAPENAVFSRRDTLGELEEGTGLLGSLQKGLDAVGGEDVLEVVNKAKELLHSSSSSAYGDKQKGQGFDVLDLKITQTKGIIEPAMVGRFLNATVLRSEQLRHLDLERREAIGFAMEELVLFSSTNDKSNQNFDLTFSDNAGRIQFMAITFKIRPDGDYTVFRSGLTGNFKLAKDYVIVSHSKSNFFGSQSWDEIVYFDRGLTGGDIADIMNIVFVPSKLLLELKVPGLRVD